MSTPYGDIKTRDDKTVYWDASGSGQRISLCGKDDTDVIATFKAEDAIELYTWLRIALEHCGHEV